jgi:serine/threonine-protein kinase
VPHVVRVLEIGGLDAPTPYIAMERLEGEDLAELLRRRRQLSIRATLGLVREVGSGLEAAHAAGIVHRDIKPRNLFLAESESTSRWKILDFGISKLAHQSGTLTRGDLLGTPAYMAPEQASGGPVTRLSDLYSLGVICYRTLTGRPAFSGIALPDTVYKVVHTMPPRPSTSSASLPPGIDDVLAVALAKDPADRFQTLGELVAALEIVEKGRFHPRLRERAHALLADHPWSDEAEPAEPSPSQSRG